jgi:4-carboxymuconolactone decarboxylase
VAGSNNRRTNGTIQTGEQIVKSNKHESGMKVRRAVLGDAYVDKAIASATEFTRPLQDMVTENCWGEVWTREALPRTTRSLITIATLAALKASEELKGHVLGALRNGCTVEEIREVLLHSTVYCGVPSGIEAFRAAKPVIEAWQQEHGST